MFKKHVHRNVLRMKLLCINNDAIPESMLQLVQIFTDLGSPIVLHYIQSSLYLSVLYTTQSATPQFLQKYYNARNQLTAGL
jgi:hypothetical protein